MAMGPERSKHLHNFTLPCLKWGNQRHLRCMKVTSDGGAAAAASPSTGDRRSQGMRFENSAATRKRELEGEMKHKFPLSGRDSEKRIRISKSIIDGGGDGEDGIEAVREKIMFDLKTAADKMKDAILRKEAGDEEEEEEEKEQEQRPAATAPSPATTATSVEESRPWNLRTRRAACKAPIADGGGSGKCLKIEEMKHNHSSPPRTDYNNGNGAMNLPPKSRASQENPGRTKLSVPLSKSEIEEDFIDMFGHRPPRRPKKRPRNVQRTLDTLFPGLWLSEITLDTYKVPETPDNGKR